MKCKNGEAIYYFNYSKELLGSECLCNFGYIGETCRINLFIILIFMLIIIFCIYKFKKIIFKQKNNYIDIEKGIYNNKIY